MQKAASLLQQPEMQLTLGDFLTISSILLSILVDRDFPESVERFYSEEFKQKLAISFLNSSILTDDMIQIRLNNRKIEEWKVELTVLEEKAMVDLSFSNRYIF